MVIAQGGKPKVRISSEFVPIGLVVLSILTIGALAWRGFRVQKSEALEQASATLQQVCQTTAKNGARNSTQDNQKAEAARRSLTQIPNFPGFEYQAAQEILERYGTCGQSGSQTLEQARALIHRNSAQIQANSVVPIGVLQATQQDLSQAMQRLSSATSTATTNGGDRQPVAQDLAQARSTLGIVNRKLEAEEIAQRSLKQADSLYRQSAQLIRNPAQVQAAQNLLNQAIQLVSTIPIEANSANQARQTLAVYQQQLATLQGQSNRDEFNLLVRDFQKLAGSVNSSMDYAEYIHQVGQLRARLNRFGQFPTTRSQASFQTLVAALDHYEDAGGVWQYCQQGNCEGSAALWMLDLRRSLLWLPQNLRVRGVPLLQKYRTIAVTPNVWGDQYIHLNEALLEIWTQADRRVQSAAGAR